MHSVQIYRDNLPLYIVKPDSDSAQVKRVMGDNVVTLNFTENQYIDFKIGDKTQIFEDPQDHSYNRDSRVDHRWQFYVLGCL